MSHRLVLAAALALPVLATGSTARAQGAPGDCGACYAPPAPVVVVASTPEVDLSDRLGVGLHVASLAIADHDDPDADPTQFAGGGLQVRYRLGRRWELGLELATLRQHDEDGEPIDGAEDVHTGALGAMFHMRPGRHLDWYFSGGVGGLHVGDHADHDDAEDTRALGYLGIGLEYRWQHLALGAELRAVGIAPVDADHGDARMTVPPAAPHDDEGDAAAAVNLAATYYF